VSPPVLAYLHQQPPVSQRQRPLPTRPAIRDLGPAALGYQPHQLAELTRLQPGERGNPLRPRRCDHLHHNKMINYRLNEPPPGLRDIP
jgi:hypothetical protein